MLKYAFQLTCTISHMKQVRADVRQCNNMHNSASRLYASVAYTEKHSDSHRAGDDSLTLSVHGTYSDPAFFS